MDWSHHGHSDPRGHESEVNASAVKRASEDAFWNVNVPFHINGEDGDRADVNVPVIVSEPYVRIADAAFNAGGSTM
jgi:hypothetical protein